MNKSSTSLALLFVALLAAGALLGLAGCASAPPPPPPAIYWPPPPATPRLEWVNTIRSQHDFPKTETEKRVESFLGYAPANTFLKPTGVACGAGEEFYVADLDLHNVKIIDLARREIRLLQDAPFGELLIGMAADSQGRLYVVDGGRKVISVFDPRTRKLLFGFGGPEFFDKPGYLALNEKLGRIYVSDQAKHQVVVFDLAGKHLFSFGGIGEGLGQLYAPNGVAIAPNGDVYVAEFLNTRIHVFDADGKPLRFFGERGDREWQFEGPRGLAFTSDGYLVVADARKSALALYSREGQPMLFLGGRADSSVLGFTLPTGVCVDRNDRIHITDTLNKSVTIWQYLSPDYLRAHPLDPAELKRVEEMVRPKLKDGPDTK